MGGQEDRVTNGYGRLALPGVSDLGVLGLRAVAVRAEMATPQVFRMSDISWSDISILNNLIGHRSGKIVCLRSSIKGTSPGSRAQVYMA